MLSKLASVVPYGTEILEDDSIQHTMEFEGACRIRTMKLVVTKVILEDLRKTAEGLSKDNLTRSIF
jgi:hypothetical protein